MYTVWRVISCRLNHLHTVFMLIWFWCKITNLCVCDKLFQSLTPRSARKQSKPSTPRSRSKLAEEETTPRSCRKLKYKGRTPVLPSRGGELTRGCGSALEQARARWVSRWEFVSPLSFPSRISPLRFQARCHRRRLNLGYNLSRFICCSCIFVFDDLYFMSIGLVLCSPRYIVFSRDFILALIVILSVLAKRLAGKSVSAVTWWVLSRMLTLTQSISHVSCMLTWRVMYMWGINRR